MFRYILFGLVVYALYRMVKRPRQEVTPPDGPKELVQDPYCRTYFPRERAHLLKVEGKTLYFCSRECLQAFQSGKKEE